MVEWEENYLGEVILNITLVGEKTLGEYGYSTIEYKLTDSEGYVVDSGTMISDKLAKGDKFKNWKESFYSLSPGEYKLQLYDNK